MKLSVIIVTWNSAKEIIACLDSVFTQNDASLEAIIIDNASIDSTVQLLDNYNRRILLIINKTNLGFAAAVNQGLAKASGEYILLLNPDTIMQPGSLTSLLSFMEANPEAGALGPQLLNPDGIIQPSCREFPRPAHFLWEFTGLAKIFAHHRIFGSWRMGYFDHQSQREVDQPMGACLLVRKAAIDQIGPMDAVNYPMFYNEVDWCLRIKQHGWKIFFLPEAKVFHHHGTSTQKARRAMMITSHRSLSCYLIAHYPGQLSAILTIALLYLILPFRLLWNLFSPKQ